MLKFELVTVNQLDKAIQLELDGYPADEAASLESFQLRQSQASDLFLGAFEPLDAGLIGFVCGTRASGSTLTHESMSRHDPEGSAVCIHSVCVAESHRRQGVALALLKEYAERIRNISELKVERVLLIAHEELIPLYTKANFVLVGQSAVQHGARPWFEMRYDL
ncbi:hypothetical protein D9757_006074 [Collybiopsis confluens]|uniref:N-acetyltransferase domain-containing protein n=1 Tax=Collybiopsis confluens TaxID=2823264 RepID=A0A8H5M6V8_9AGAR|nr:hypothetical protein D9757_006074 [Collybiopsis confluens]